MLRDAWVDVYGNEEAMFMDGFDDCICGAVERCGSPVVVAYSKIAVLEKLIGGGLTPDEAVEWMYYNQLGAWVGEHTPAFVDLDGVNTPESAPEG